MTTHDVSLNGFVRKHGRYTIRVLINDGDRVLVTDEHGNRINPLPRDVAGEAIALSTEVAMWRQGQSATREQMQPYLDEIMGAIRSKR